MQAYYLPTATFRARVLDKLTAEFNSTGQVLYWLVREYLLANYEHFVSECDKLGYKPISLGEVRPVGAFLPWSVYNESERDTAVKNALTDLMNVMTKEEWDKLEENYGKAQKINKVSPSSKVFDTPDKQVKK